MTIEQLQERLGRWNQFLCVILGASAMMLMLSVMEVLNPRWQDFYWMEYFPAVYIPGWYFVWLIAQVTAISAAFHLARNTSWQRLPLPERLNAIFGFLAAAWMAIVSLAIKLPFMFDHGPGLFFLGVGPAVGLIYWYLRKRYLHAPEEMFP
jgi:hypothetical protein